MRTRALPAWHVVAFITVIGCGRASQPPPPDLSQVAVPAVDRYVVLPFDVTIEDQTTKDVSIQHNVGWIRRPSKGDAIPVVMYDKEPWPHYGISVYAGIGVAANEWVPVWIYCDGSEWFTVWYGSTLDGTLSYASGQGACTDTNSVCKTNVQLPASVPSVPQLPKSVEITGAGITLIASGEGMVSLDGYRWKLAPYAFVDCTECEPGKTWYEVHSLLWKDSSSACNGIIYLYPDNIAQVTLSGVVCLPGLDQPLWPEGRQYSAAWKVHATPSP